MTQTNALPLTTAPMTPGDRAQWTALTAIAPAVWGTTYVVTTEMLPPDHPIFASLMRALPVGLLALAITRVLPRGEWWWKAAVLGVLNMGIFFPLLFIAAERLPGGVAATLGASQPLIVAVLVIFLLSERPSLWRLGWGVSGVVGVGLVVLGPEAAFDLIGVAAGIGCAVSMAFGVTLTKRWGRPAGAGPMTLAGWQLTAGGLFLLPLTIGFAGVPSGIDSTAVAGYAWLGIVGALLAYTLWFRGIGALPVTATALLGLLAPLVAAAMGALLLGQTFTWLQLTGFAIALTALVAGQLSPQHVLPSKKGTQEA